MTTLDVTTAEGRAAIRSVVEAGGGFTAAEMAFSTILPALAANTGKQKDAGSYCERLRLARPV